jgi:hypothetical protein
LEQIRENCKPVIHQKDFWTNEGTVTQTVGLNITNCISKLNNCR